jgi:hypothetical protein
MMEAPGGDASGGLANTGSLPPTRDFPERVCFVQRGNLLIVLLCGGDKDSQARDIAAALTLAKEV